MKNAETRRHENEIGIGLPKRSSFLNDTCLRCERVIRPSRFARGNSRDAQYLAMTRGARINKVVVTSAITTGVAAIIRRATGNWQ